MRLPGWLPIALISGSVVALSLLFLWPSFGAFPMDDTYIHFVYARNLAERGRLFFNFTHEAGVGTTSILWVLLLAAGLKLGISSAILAKLLGVASLVVVCMVLYVLLRGIWGPVPALLAAWLVVASLPSEGAAQPEPGPARVSPAPRRSRHSSNSMDWSSNRLKAAQMALRRHSPTVLV